MLDWLFKQKVKQEDAQVASVSLSRINNEEIHIMIPEGYQVTSIINSENYIVLRKKNYDNYEIKGIY